MSHSYEELQSKTVAELRVIAKESEHDALRGYTTLHKEDLVKALCTALGVEAHTHHGVSGLDKAPIKAKIRELKVQRNEALEGRDYHRLKILRRRIHRLKRKIRAGTV